MMGRAGHAVFFDVGSDVIDWVPLDIESAGMAFLVIDTRAAHALVDGGYAARRASCETAAARLGIPSLSRIADVDAALARLKSEPDGDVLVRRTRHVITENARVLAALEALRDSDLRAFGALMDASHASLRDDFEVSTGEMDALVDTLSSRPGVFGARMTGGGFGGCVVALCRHGALTDGWVVQPVGAAAITTD